MLVLTATTDHLQVVLAGAITTNQLQCFCCWRDITTTAYTPGRTQSVTNNTTDVDLVAPPASSTQRVIDRVNIYNADTVAATVTVKIDLNATESILIKPTLQSGETLIYEDGLGWSIFNAQGILKTSPSNSANSSAVLNQPGFATAALTGVRTIDSSSTKAVYVGKAPRALTSLQIRLRVTTAVAVITWAEVGIGKGPIVVGGNPTITPVGFVDVSASHNSTGQKTHTVNVSAGQAINEGDDLWVLVGCAAGTATVLRAATMADDLQVGTQAAATTRPSTTIGTGVSYTLDGATVLAPWVVAIV